jgi:hypothetical protein
VELLALEDKEAQDCALVEQVEHHTWEQALPALPHRLPEVVVHKLDANTEGPGRALQTTSHPRRGLAETEPQGS